MWVEVCDVLLCDWKLDWLSTLWLCCTTVPAIWLYTVLQLALGTGKRLKYIYGVPCYDRAIFSIHSTLHDNDCSVLNLKTRNCVWVTNCLSDGQLSLKSNGHIFSDFFSWLNDFAHQFPDLAWTIYLIALLYIGVFDHVIGLTKATSYDDLCNFSTFYNWPYAHFYFLSICSQCFTIFLKYAK